MLELKVVAAPDSSQFMKIITSSQYRKLEDFEKILFLCHYCKYFSSEIFN